MAKFKQGDIVYLNSGSPALTVEFYSQGHPDTVHVTCVTAQHTVMQASFNEACLSTKQNPDWHFKDDPKLGLAKIPIGKETLIHIQGLPFWLPAGSTILGRLGNWKLAQEFEQERSNSSGTGDVGKVT